MINLDPAIVDQETLRKKRRKKMLLLAMLPVFLLLLAGAFFLRPGFNSLFYSINYDNHNAGAVSFARMQEFANILEPYIAHYNAGTSLIQSGDGKEAEKELRQSLANNPPNDKICQVRVNLSYSIELQADNASAHSRFSEALTLYSRAEGILYEDGCASKQPEKVTSRDANAERAASRISGKRNQVVAKKNTNPDTPEDDNNQDQKEEISEEELDAITQMTIDGTQLREEVRDSQYFSIGNSNSYNKAPERW